MTFFASALAVLAAHSGVGSGQEEPSYVAARVAGTAGELLDPGAEAWDRSAEEIAWGPAPYRTRFRALWSASGLHVRFDSEDDDPWSTMTRRDDPLWEEEVVEIFIDAAGDGRYVEVEVSPAGVVCDLRRLAPGETGTDPIGPMDRGFDVAGLRSAVVPSGDGWTALIFLPWTGLGLPEGAEAGARMRFNAFRIKRPGGPTAPMERAVFAAWSPTGVPNFHVPEAFRAMVLAP